MCSVSEVVIFDPSVRCVFLNCLLHRMSLKCFKPEWNFRILTNSSNLGIIYNLFYKVGYSLKNFNCVYDGIPLLSFRAPDEYYVLNDCIILSVIDDKQAFEVPYPLYLIALASRNLSTLDAIFECFYRCRVKCNDPRFEWCYREFLDFGSKILEVDFAPLCYFNIADRIYYHIGKCAKWFTSYVFLLLHVMLLKKSLICILMQLILLTRDIRYCLILSFRVLSKLILCCTGIPELA